MKAEITYNSFLTAAILVGVLALLAHEAKSQIYTEAHGYVKISVTPGTGSTKKTTLFSLPLLSAASIDGRVNGRITDVGHSSVTSEGAGWMPGQLSNPTEPYLLEITSGAAKGRMLLVSTTAPNTSDTLTISALELEAGTLDRLGIATGAADGDTYTIRPVDTLGSFFGEPAAGLVQGGLNAKTADTITLVVNGSASTYFLNTSSSPARWSKVALGTPDADNVPIPPYAALQYARIADGPLEFFVAGEVPTGQRAVALRNSGSTLFSPHWPQDQTLSSLGLHNVPGWRKGAGARDADTVVLVSGGSAATYFHNGEGWRKVSVGSPDSDSVTVPAGGGAIVTRKGQQGGYSVYTSQQPYSLE